MHWPPTPRHALFWDATTRFMGGIGIGAGLMWYFTPYMGPALAAPSKAEEEASLLTRRFSENKALAPVVATKQN